MPGAEEGVASTGGRTGALVEACTHCKVLRPQLTPTLGSAVSKNQEFLQYRQHDLQTRAGGTELFVSGTPKTRLPPGSRSPKTLDARVQTRSKSVGSTRAS